MQVEQSPGIPEQRLTRIGEKITVPVGSIEQGRADMLFKFAQRDAYGRLSAIYPSSCFVYAALLDRGDKHLELHQVHSDLRFAESLVCALSTAAPLLSGALVSSVLGVCPASLVP